MKVSIVIPNYNGEKLLQENLPKVIEASAGAEIIVVDDASTDQSVAILQKQFPQVKVLRHTKNQGFATTVNHGVDYSHGELVLLLNSDVCPKSDFLKYLLPHFKDLDVFGVGCLQYSQIEWKEKTVHGRGIGQFKKGFLIHAPGKFNKTNTLWIFGGAGIFRKSIWEKLHGIETIYEPFYWEDIDLSYRALRAGYKLIFEPRSVVYHDQKRGAIRISYTKDYVKTVALRNQILFVWLNITDKDFLFEHFLYLPRYLFKAIISFDFAFLVGFTQAFIKLPKVLFQREKNKKLFRLNDKEVLFKFVNEF